MWPAYFTTNDIMPAPLLRSYFRRLSILSDKSAANLLLQPSRRARAHTHTSQIHYSGPETQNPLKRAQIQPLHAARNTITVVVRWQIRGVFGWRLLLGYTSRCHSIEHSLCMRKGPASTPFGSVRWPHSASLWLCRGRLRSATTVHQPPPP
jgi:hypothetical protein